MAPGDHGRCDVGATPDEDVSDVDEEVVSMAASTIGTTRGEVMEGDTRALDTKILRALRRPDDPTVPIGPAWVEVALLDLTAGGNHRDHIWPKFASCEA